MERGLGTQCLGTEDLVNGEDSQVFRPQFQFEGSAEPGDRADRMKPHNAQTTETDARGPRAGRMVPNPCDLPQKAWVTVSRPEGGIQPGP